MSHENMFLMYKVLRDSPDVNVYAYSSYIELHNLK